MSNEKLVEEARNWDQGETTKVFDLLDRLADALEAAEKAHTPTDDEREALIAAIKAECERVFYEDRDDRRGGYEIAADVALSTIRRSEVPEPSAEPRITIEHEGGNTVTGTPEQVLNHGHLKPGWRYVGAEPQGEPSDVLADEIEDRMRRQDWLPAGLAIRAVAALRAAAVAVTEQGENR